MKNFFSFSVLSILIIAGVMAFSKKKLASAIEFKSKAESVECFVYYDYNSNVKAFTASSNLLTPTTTLDRKNIVSFSGPELLQLKNAVARMKSLPASDPTSWAFQAAIHGGEKCVNPNFSTCQHFPSCFFLAWHRMYLYFFERILRSKMTGSWASRPMLPYWDYQTSPGLPLAFKISTSSLYNESRYAVINGTGILPPSVNTAINTSLGFENYYKFQNDLSTSHGMVHGFIGGDMSDYKTAANDPIFWLHHANIDRLWEHWLRIPVVLVTGSGAKPQRCNPDTLSDPSWWNQRFIFYDADSTVISMTASQVVNIASSLNYKYIGEPLPLPIHTNCNRSPGKCPPPPSGIIIIITYPNYSINQRISKLEFGKIESKTIDSVEQVNPKGQFNFNETENTNTVNLEFENITANKLPEGVIEVYVNPKNINALEVENPSFAGILDLFAASALKAHNEMHHNGALRINIDKVIKNLNLGISDLKKLQLVFVSRGNYLNGKEILTSGDITIGKSSIVVYGKK